MSGLYDPVAWANWEEEQLQEMREENREVETFYIAGPMRGRPNKNYDAFNKLAYYLQFKLEVNVVNPANSFAGDQNKELKDYFSEELPQLTECDAIVFLPEWWQSSGAKIEYALAKELGLRMYEAVDTDPDETDAQYYDFEITEGVQPPVGHEGDRLVYGARRDAYKDPRIDFEGTAKMWSAIVGADITLEMVPMMMICLKLNRLRNNPTHEDSLYDIVGYASTLQWINRVKDEGQA